MIKTKVRGAAVSSVERALEKIRKARGKAFTTKADIQRIQAARVSGDWSAVFASRLYRLHSGEYCELLQYVEKEVEETC